MTAVWVLLGLWVVIHVWLAVQEKLVELERRRHAKEDREQVSLWADACVADALGISLDELRAREAHLSQNPPDESR